MSSPHRAYFIVVEVIYHIIEIKESKLSIFKSKTACIHRKFIINLVTKRLGGDLVTKPRKIVGIKPESSCILTENSV